MLTSTGVSGRCCQLAFSCGNRSEGLVAELSLEFCATEFVGVQLTKSIDLDGNFLSKREAIDEPFGFGVYGVCVLHTRRSVVISIVF